MTTLKQIEYRYSREEDRDSDAMILVRLMNKFNGELTDWMVDVEEGLIEELRKKAVVQGWESLREIIDS